MSGYHATYMMYKKDLSPRTARDVNLKPTNHHITMGEMMHEVGGVIEKREMIKTKFPV